MVILLALCVVTLAACSQSSPTPTFTTVATPTSVAESRVATDGDTAAVHYTGTLDSGEVFDSSREREPLSFVLGGVGVISGFDAAVHGLKVGDTITVRLEPAEAYGERDDALIPEFPIDQLPEGLTEGDSVSLNGSPGVITKVNDEVFRVDFNHRLAGQALTFDIELVSIE